MKHFTRLLSVIAVILSLASAKSVKAADAAVRLIGFMTVDQRWLDSQDPESAFGFYEFNSDGSTDFRAISPVGPDNDWASNGAAYANGRYYCYSVWGNWMKYTLTFRVFDAATWKLVTSSSFTYESSNSGSEQSKKAAWIPSTLLYDVISDRILAFTHRYSNSDSGQLAEVNRETGELTRIADTQFITAAACDAQGTIHAINKSGELGTVKADGTFTLTGHTGFLPTRDSEKNGGAAFDFRSGKLYWSLYGFTTANDRDYNVNPRFGLVEITPSDPASSKISFEYPASNQLSAVIVDNAHPDAPDAIGDLEFTTDAADPNVGVISFGVPSKTFGQAQLRGNVKVTVTLDQQPFVETTAAAGSRFTRSTGRLADGNHSITVKLEANGHSNTETYATTYFGYDTPKSVTDIKVTYNEAANNALISWQLPAKGINEGNLNAADVRYRIVRYPDRKTVARSARETTFTDNLGVSFNKYYYRIYPYYSSNPEIEGKGATSPTTLMGSPLDVPYSQTFDDASSMDLYTLIDANGDANPDPTWDSPNWTYDEQYGCAFYYGKADHPADDYLVLPALNLRSDRLYKLSYKYYAYYGYGSHLRVVAGKDATPEGLSTRLLDKEFTSNFYEMPGNTEEVVFCPKNGEKFIAIHHISTTMEHLSIDDISVTDLSSVDVPAAPVGLTAKGVASDRVLLSFTVPDETAGGTPLKGELTATIYKGEDRQEAAAVTVKPGQKAEWTDTQAARGINIYTVKLSNEAGTGISATVRINLMTGIPTQLPSVKATAINNGQVEVTWDSSIAAKDPDGNPLDPSSIRFLVYKPMGDDISLIGRDIVGNRFIDSNPFEGLEKTQQVVAYYVAAVNDAGEGDARDSNPVFIGKSLDLPFAETWKNQVPATSPWVRALAGGATWYIAAKGYDPLCDGQDGYGMMSCEIDGNNASGVGTAAIASPRLDLTTHTAPVLTFWLYQDPSYSDKVRLSIGVDTGNNVITSIPGAEYMAKADKAGWKKITLPLDSYASCSELSVVFYGSVVNGQRLHFDNVSVTGARKSAEIRLVSMTGAGKGIAGEPAEVTAEISNDGSADVSNLTVSLKADGIEVARRTVASVKAGASLTATIDWTPAEATGDPVELTCELTAPAGADTDSGNNTLRALFEAAEPDYAVVTAVRSAVNANAVELRWDAPTRTRKLHTTIDDVEAYDAFAIDNVGYWTMIDGDKTRPYTFSNGFGGTLSWPNHDSLQAFTVFNPSEVHSATMPFTTYSGRQAFVSWAAAGTANDDWLVSPELSGNQQLISFVARAASGETTSDEPFMVYYSTTGTDRADFINLSGDVPVKAGADWRLYHYLLPEGATHFAIRYVGDNSFALVVDDILFCAHHDTRRPDGYNLYRNGVKLNKEPLTERTFTDTDVHLGDELSYQVSAIFNTRESEFSHPHTVTVSGLGDVVTGNCIIAANAGSILISGAEGLHVAVYAIDGTCIFSAAGETEMSIAVNPGLYLVSAGGRTAKLLVNK